MIKLNKLYDKLRIEEYKEVLKYNKNNKKAL